MELFKKIKRFLPVTGVIALTACGAMSLSDIPITVVTSDGYVLSGMITPRMDYTSSFVMTLEQSSVICQGETGANGAGGLSCSNGFWFEIQIPDYPSTNGSYVAGYDAAGNLVGDNQATRFVAIGYGNEANTAALQGILP